MVNLRLPFFKRDSPIEDDQFEKTKEEFPKDEVLTIVKDEMTELASITKEISEKIKLLDERTRKIEGSLTNIQQTVDIHKQEIEELKTAFDKVIALYELVANTFNPFVEMPEPKKSEEKVEKEEVKVETEKPKEVFLPLNSLKKDPLSLAVVLGWLNYLVERGGIAGAKKALEYYKTVGWITENVYIELLKYLKGFAGIDKGERSLMPEDHVVSLYFITKIKSGVTGKMENYKKMYEELVEKGIIEPTVFND